MKDDEERGSGGEEEGEDGEERDKDGDERVKCDEQSVMGGEGEGVASRVTECDERVT